MIHIISIRKLIENARFYARFMPVLCSMLDSNVYAQINAGIICGSLFNTDINVTVILGGLLQHKKSFHHETQCDRPLLGVA